MLLNSFSDANISRIMKNHRQNDEKLHSHWKLKKKKIIWQNNSLLFTIRWLVLIWKSLAWPTFQLSSILFFRSAIVSKSLHFDMQFEIHLKQVSQSTWISFSILLSFSLSLCIWFIAQFYLFDKIFYVFQVIVCVLIWW